MKKKVALVGALVAVVAILWLNSSRTQRPSQLPSEKSPDSRVAAPDPARPEHTGLRANERSGEADPPRSLLRGVVRSSLGYVLSEAHVTLAAVEATTDISGRFTLVLEPATFSDSAKVHARHTSHGERDFVFNLRSEGAAIDLGDLILFPSTTRRLRVIDPQGRGIAAVRAFTTPADPTSIPSTSKGMRRRGHWAWQPVGTTDPEGWLDVKTPDPQPVLLLEGPDNRVEVTVLPREASEPTLVVLGQSRILRVRLIGDPPRDSDVVLLVEGQTSDTTQWTHAIRTQDGAAEIRLSQGGYRLSLLVDDLIITSKQVQLEGDRSEALEFGRFSVLEVRALDSQGASIEAFAATSFPSRESTAPAALSSREVAAIFRSARGSEKGLAVLVVPWSLDRDAKSDVVVVRAEGYEIGWTAGPRAAGMSVTPVDVTLRPGPTVEGRLEGAPPGLSVALHLVTSSAPSVSLSYVREQAPRISRADLRADGTF